MLWCVKLDCVVLFLVSRGFSCGACVRLVNFSAFCFLLVGSVRGSSDVCHFAVGIDPKPLWSRGFLRSVGVFV